MATKTKKRKAKKEPASEADSATVATSVTDPETGEVTVECPDQETAEAVAKAFAEPPKPAAISPEDLAAYDAQTAGLVTSAELVCRESEAAYETAKTHAAARKKEFEADVEHMRKVIRDRNEQRGKPVQKTLIDFADGTPAATVAEAELWREYPIERWATHGLTAKDIEKLHTGEIKSGGTHPIVTVGDLNNFVTPNKANPDYARAFTDLKGIGEMGATRISDAHDLFWAWWRKGGEEEFAKEKGVNHEPVAEPGSGLSEAGDRAAEASVTPGKPFGASADPAVREQSVPGPGEAAV